jgi:hypothetical protein
VPTETPDPKQLAYAAQRQAWREAVAALEPYLKQLAYAAQRQAWREAVAALEPYQHPQGSPIDGQYRLGADRQAS